MRSEQNLVSGSGPHDPGWLDCYEALRGGGLRLLLLRGQDDAIFLRERGGVSQPDQPDVSTSILSTGHTLKNKSLSLNLLVLNLHN